MTSVYALVDDAPPTPYGGFSIIRIYKTRKLAIAAMNKLIWRDAFANQYVGIIRYTVRGK